ncbi:hypothetical protein AAEU28_15280 [Pseudoalteromonas sp. SS15]|uniref:hypothetical protein n=1 Tax=Pseudoalteromonas sp. SS15 TaxID=3139393 RepID=UPI003BAD0A05
MGYSIYRFYVIYDDNLKGTFGSTDFMSGLLTPAHLTYTKTRREVNSLLPRRVTIYTKHKKASAL